MEQPWARAENAPFAAACHKGHVYLPNRRFWPSLASMDAQQDHFWRDRSTVYYAVPVLAVLVQELEAAFAALGRLVS